MPNTAEIEHRLRTDYPYYAEHCLKIIDQRARTVALRFKRAQKIVDATLEAQAAEGKPMRAIVLKARKLGVSTAVVGKATHRYTQHPNHKALIVAHDLKTSKEIFGMAQLMYDLLPDEQIGGLTLKPGIVSSRRGQEIALGQESRVERRKGNIGLNSSLLVDTAGEVQAGRGFTYFTLLLSEVAFWPDEQKMTALLNAVPDEPETLIVVESTANGYNFFRRMWKQAEEGISDYAPIFFPWFDEPEYRRPFTSFEHREEFRAGLGGGEFGEDEPELLAMLEGLSAKEPERPDPLEQLHWRRWAIINRTAGDLRTFQQEYPSTPDEAFLATGRTVFSISLVSRVIERAEKLSAQQGKLEGADYEERQIKGHTYRIPKRAIWLPREEVDIAPVSYPWWHRWEEPFYGNHKSTPGFRPMDPIVPPGQYIVANDPASGEENTLGERAFMAIQVIDHRSRKQVARYRSRLDPDEVTLQLYLVGRYYNDAWIMVEKTGGYGLSIINALWSIYRYPKIFARRAADVRNEHMQDRLGWDTTAVTKPWLIDHMKELLRTGTDGIRDPLTAGEFVTLVRDERGRVGPESEAFADLAMAYMIGQHGAQQIPVPTFRAARGAPTRAVLSRAGGY